MSSRLRRWSNRAVMAGALASAVAQERWSPRSANPAAAALGWAGPFTLIAPAMSALAALGRGDPAGLATAAATGALLRRRGMKVTPEAPVDFTVLVHNVMATNRHGARVARQLAVHDPDIAVLVELHDRHLPALERLENRHLALLPSRGFTGAGVVSRWPVDDIRSTTTGPNTALVVRTGGLTVVALHLPAPRLSFPIPSVLRQERAVAALLTVVRSVDGPLVVAGDLNATRWNSAHRRLVDGLGVVDAVARVAGERASFPAPFPVIAIDHCLTRGVAPRWARWLGSAGSDHRGLLVGIDRAHPGTSVAATP